MLKKIILLLTIVGICLFYGFKINAFDIDGKIRYTIGDYEVLSLNDNSYDSYYTISPDQDIKIHSEESIKYLYIIYEMGSVTGKLTTHNETVNLGKDGYLHEFIELNNPSNDLTLKYDDYVTISEVRCYPEGEIPNDVQRWTRDYDADLIIFSTHADDEVLFFAGIMPTYLNQDKKIHVTYVARHDMGHRVNQKRLHEQLDGLWTLGIKDYPTFGIVEDQKSLLKKHDKKNYDKTIKKVQEQVKLQALTDDDVIEFMVKNIRLYKPDVVVGHDVYGEYGHGQHVYNTYILKQAVLLSNDKTYKVDELAPYNIPKVYIHLYDMKNTTTLDLDTPLDMYNGKTAYQMCKEAFLKHVTQQKSKYPAWLNGANNEYTSAKDIKTTSPMYWGLFYTTVGPDVKKNDLFENIK